MSVVVMILRWLFISCVCVNPLFGRKLPGFDKTEKYQQDYLGKYQQEANKINSKLAKNNTLQYNTELFYYENYAENREENKHTHLPDPYILDKKAKEDKRVKYFTYKPRHVNSNAIKRVPPSPYNLNHANGHQHSWPYFEYNPGVIYNNENSYHNRYKTVSNKDEKDKNGGRYLGILPNGSPQYMESINASSGKSQVKYEDILENLKSRSDSNYHPVSLEGNLDFPKGNPVVYSASSGSTTKGVSLNQEKLRVFLQQNNIHHFTGFESLKTSSEDTRVISNNQPNFHNQNFVEKTLESINSKTPSSSNNYYHGNKHPDSMQKISKVKTYSSKVRQVNENNTTNTNVETKYLSKNPSDVPQISFQKERFLLDPDVMKFFQNGGLQKVTNAFSQEDGGSFKNYFNQSYISKFNSSLNPAYLDNISNSSYNDKYYSSHYRRNNYSSHNFMDYSPHQDERDSFHNDMGLSFHNQYDMGHPLPEDKIYSFQDNNFNSFQDIKFNSFQEDELASSQADKISSLRDDRFKTLQDENGHSLLDETGFSFYDYYNSNSLHHGKHHHSQDKNLQSFPDDNGSEYNEGYEHNEGFSNDKKEDLRAYDDSVRVYRDEYHSSENEQKTDNFPSDSYLDLEMASINYDRNFFPVGGYNIDKYFEGFPAFGYFNE